jgi:hypothetical protein
MSDSEDLFRPLHRDFPVTVTYRTSLELGNDHDDDGFCSLKILPS